MDFSTSYPGNGSSPSWTSNATTGMGITNESIDQSATSIYCWVEGEPHKRYFETYFVALFATLLTMVTIATIVGNVMVITVILTNRSMRDLNRGTNMFLFNLAIADLLVGTLMVPISIHTVIKECWDFSETFCIINNFLNTTCFLTSIHTLMYIAFYKYKSIKRITGNNFDSMKKWPCYIMIIAAWCWGIFFAILTNMVLSKSLYKAKTMQCGPMYPVPEPKHIILYLANQTFNIFIPIGFMTFCYVRIFLLIREQTSIRRRMSHSSDSSAVLNERGVTKTLFIVLACFILCWTPYTIYSNYATYIEDKTEIPFYLNPLAYTFGYMNSACNPIIYAWRFPEFRQGYKDIVRRTSFRVTVDGGRRVVRPHSLSVPEIHNPHCNLSSSAVDRSTRMVNSHSTELQRMNDESHKKEPCACNGDNTEALTSTY